MAKHRVPLTRWVAALGLGIAGAVAVGVLVLAFVWPSATARAQGLPIGISGPASQVRMLKDTVAKQDPVPIVFETVRSRAQAEARIRNRTEYGAILLGTHTTVLTASAGSAATNQILRGIASTLQGRIDAGVERGLTTKLAEVGASAAAAGKSAAAANKALGEAKAAVAAGRVPTFPSSPSSGASTTPSSKQSAPAAPEGASSASLPTVAVVDVVPLSKHDPTGGGLNAAAFPIVLGGMVGGVLVSLLVVGVLRRVLALLVYAIAAGALTALILQTWLQVLQRDWLTNAAALGLAMLATAAVVVGFNGLLGTAGIPIGAVLAVLVGNPLSGAAFPYQFIPHPWGQIGQYFVAGAGANLLRSLSYFPNAATGQQWTVLGAWAVGGFVVAAIGHAASRAIAHRGVHGHVAEEHQAPHLGDPAPEGSPAPA